MHPYSFDHWGRLQSIHEHLSLFGSGGYLGPFGAIIAKVVSGAALSLNDVEPVANILLFVPLGASLVLLLRRTRLGWAPMLAVAIGSCALFSLSIEVLQVERLANTARSMAAKL